MKTVVEQVLESVSIVICGLPAAILPLFSYKHILLE